jgi:polysaccharide export outer membrane protein
MRRTREIRVERDRHRRRGPAARFGLPLLLASLVFTGLLNSAVAQEAGEGYRIRAGDVLTVSVWREEDLQLEVVVRPDGGISIPLAGEIQAAGQSIEGLRREITDRLAGYIPDLVVTVAAKQLQGNKIYVIGKVARPGEFVLNSRVDVMQALSMAGGTIKFADLDEIKILRRVDGKESVIAFDYTRLERGEALEQNVLLEVGDVVVVP